MAPRLQWSLAFQNFIFPPVCYSCGTLISTHRALLCPGCRSQVREATPGDPLFILARERLCHDGTCAGLMALYHFAAGGPVQDLLHALKYSGMTGVGRSLGADLGAVLRHTSWMADIDCIVPLPLFRVRQRERGYNQAESIARGISRIARKPVRTRLVRRTRWTDSQTTLGYAARQLNVRDAFVVSARKMAFVSGKKVLLVDDVVTTGATTRSCAAALHAGGAAAVFVAAVALAEQVP